MRPRATLINLGLAGLAALLAVGSLFAGPMFTPLDVLIHPHDPRFTILWELRAPRTLLAALIGGTLGLSGAALQGFSRNPLADPGVLGVSASAAFGAVLALYFGWTAASSWLLPLAAMAGAGLGVFVLLALGGSGGGVTRFLLAGAAVNTLAGAGVALALSLAPGPWAQGEIMTWLMGSLSDRSFEEVRLAAPFMLTGAAILLLQARALDAFTLGEAGARSLGVSPARMQGLLALALGLSVGSGVAVAGVIGFVGLIAPHLMRPFVGERPGALLVPSALAGMVLTLAADSLIRLLPTGAELRLGVVMSALGAPFFLALLILRRRSLT
jgi:iron complex transport system permease protein